MTPGWRVLVSCLFISLFTPVLVAQLLNETFDYPVGQLTDLNGGSNMSGGKWVTISGTGNPILVTQGSLFYTRYPSSGGGNCISVKSISSSAEDVAISFGQRTTGTLYASLLLAVTDTAGLHTPTDSIGDYFCAFLPGTSSTTFIARLSIRRGTVTRSFQLGIRTSSQNSRAEWGPFDLAVDSTHLVVFSYSFVAGSKNDIASLWVNPDLQLPGPPPLARQTSAASSEPSELSRLAIRQDGTDTPDALIDGIRVGSAWEESPLPVQLTSFSGSRIGIRSIRLEWSTQTEVNNYGFLVRRSCDGSEFREVANSFVAGGGTTLEPRRYVLIDSEACPGISYYRLQQTDLDGTVHFSERIAISPYASVAVGEPPAFCLFPCYPNPCNPFTMIRFCITEAAMASLRIYDLLGREVALLVDERLFPGQHEVAFDGRQLPSGIYVCRLMVGSHAASLKIALAK